MGWAIGYDASWQRDIGYGVPATCDHPKCNAAIDRGLAYVCHSEQARGGDTGCGLYFCDEHLSGGHRINERGDRARCCARCGAGKPPYKHPSPDTPEWLRHKLTDESWSKWRDANPDEVKAAEALLGAI